MRTPRPNYGNPQDACCCCGKLMKTPAVGDELTPKPGELGVWQPNATDPPQWICQHCHEQLEKDAQRS